MSRAFFRMDAGRFMKKFFFMFFLIWIKKFKNSLLFGGIQTTSSLVDYLSALFQAKVTFYWREKPFSKNNLIQFLSF